MQRWSIGQNSISTLECLNRTKDKKHMNFSTDAQKAFEKLQHPFMIKILKKLGIDELCLYMIKTT
jgi:hypothetical protein